ncbi:MAG: hypothetical protein ACPG4W_05865 [Flavobacteriales bacterium]
MKNILFFLFFIVSLSVSAQKKYFYKNPKFKYLPLELAINIQSPAYFGFDIGLENPIIQKSESNLIHGVPSRQLKEILSRINLANHFVKLDEFNLHQIQLSIGGSYRETYDNQWYIEPMMHFSYAYQYEIETGNRYDLKPQLTLQFGFGKNDRIYKLTDRLLYCRPGLMFDLASEQETKVHAVLAFGFQSTFQGLRLKRWANPWFKNRKKPEPEFEFSGQSYGQESGKNKAIKRKKLNKKKRKYKTLKKK